MGKRLPEEFYLERDALQNRWYDLSRKADITAMTLLSERAAVEEEAFYSRWAEAPLEECTTLPGFLGRWRKKNEALGKTPDLHRI